MNIFIIIHFLKMRGMRVLFFRERKEPKESKKYYVWQVTTELGINSNTIAKACAALEEKALVRALPKKGAFVIYG